MLFVLKFIGCYTLFYICISTPYFRANIHPLITNINAEISNFFLNLLGQDTTVSNANISSNAFSVNIKQGCDAIEPMGLFISNLIAFPAEWKKKIVGIFVGLLALFAINIARIDSLYFAGITNKQLFDIMHEEVWQFVFILLAVSFVFLWIQWSKADV